jgi:phospholipase D1/2
MTRARESAGSPLKIGKTCWRLSTARRATLLVDAEEYFAAARAALLQARRQILIAGWDFDSRIHLRPGSECSGELLSAPTELADLLGYLIESRPGLEIHVIRWDYHWM